MGRRNAAGLNDPINESQGGTNAQTFNQARTNMGLNALINSQGGSYLAVPGDRNKWIRFGGVGGYTLTLPLAATLSDGWACVARNDTLGSITVSPSGGESINLAPGLVIESGQSIEIECDGTQFFTLGEKKLPVPSSGGTMTGLLILSADPVAALGAATKQYVDSSLGAISYVNQNTSSVTMAANKTYGCNNGASLITFTLPAVAAAGDVFEIVGNSSGGWTLVYGAGQSIRYGNIVTTTTTGSLSSTDRGDCVSIICIVADTTFSVRTGSIGNITWI